MLITLWYFKDNICYRYWNEVILEALESEKGYNRSVANCPKSIFIKKKNG